MSMDKNGDLTIDQGSTFDQKLTIRRDGVILNLTGYSARMQVRENVDSVTPFIDLTSPSNGLVLGGAAGTINIQIDAATTAGFTIFAGVYDLELIAPDTTVERLIE